MTALDQALEQALEQALVAEQRACYAYGLLGPWLAGGDRPRARADAAAHAVVRDATATGLAASGSAAAAPAADYPDLAPVADPGAALRTALRVEEDCAARWRFVYLRAASTTGRPAIAARTTAQANLTASAVRAARWRQRLTPGRPATPFPGL